MDAWRLCSARRVELTGEGARRVGGRWNSPGRAVVYASESLALCLAEALVHVTGPLPADYVSLRLSVPDDAIERLDTTAIKSTWRVDLGYTRAIGDQWIEQARSLALLVPSAVVPESSNVLLNPAHPDAARLAVAAQHPFAFDPRLGTILPAGDRVSL